MSKPRIAHAIGSMIAAWKRSVTSLRRKTLATGALRYWAEAPSLATTPRPFQLGQRLPLPFRQNSHSPQVVLGLTATWSPTEKVVTSEPTAMTCLLYTSDAADE